MCGGIGKPINIRGAVDLATRGVAIAAAYGVGAIKSIKEGIAKIPTRANFGPNMENHAYYREMYEVFRNLYENIRDEYDALTAITKKYGTKATEAGDQ
mgnify:CR=1 FL=1